MPVEGVNAYPLSWPVDWPRTKWRRQAAYKVTFTKARDDLMRSLRLFGLDQRHIVLSTNVALRVDGLPLAGLAQPQDPGVAVYWMRKQKPEMLACDHWTKVEHNMRALWHAVEALRSLERCGASQVLERAFLGFAALPAANRVKPWREVLFSAPFPPHYTVELVDAAYRELAKIHHPDRGGSHDRMTEINQARAQALEELGR